MISCDYKKGVSVSDVQMRSFMDFKAGFDELSTRRDDIKSRRDMINMRPDDEYSSTDYL